MTQRYQARMSVAHTPNEVKALMLMKEELNDGYRFPRLTKIHAYCIDSGMSATEAADAISSLVAMELIRLADAGVMPVPLSCTLTKKGLDTIEQLFPQLPRIRS